jgi:hypothetical protein
MIKTIKNRLAASAAHETLANPQITRCSVESSGTG